VTAPRDTGELLAVPPEERLEVDDHLPSEDNEDQFADVSGVPDGEYVELSTASEDEPVGWPEDEEEEEV
jgi:hypothetical protein